MNMVHLMKIRALFNSSCFGKFLSIFGYCFMIYIWKHMPFLWVHNFQKFSSDTFQGTFTQHTAGISFWIPRTGHKPFLLTPQFWDKNDGENISNWNYFQIPRVLSELPANWPTLTSQKGCHVFSSLFSISQLVSVEMACLLGIQNEIQAE